jgi:hypothetical protein
MKLKAWRRTKLCAKYDGAHMEQTTKKMQVK